ncbi:MAG: elongation factor P [Microgenomates group bacterium Gr01-1014_7]|nr:MAG: elongation factor P [Microgenomates group bacterium Gr01-1014_7]
MALNVTDLRNGTVFKEAGNILQVLSYDHVKMGRGSGNIKLKVKNLKTGSVTEKSFITGARVDEADVQKKKAQFLYRDGDLFHFMDTAFEQFSLREVSLGEQIKYLKDGLEVSLIISEGEALGLELPNSLVYEIAETGPGERGNTVSNVFKEATLDNGLVVKVPMFIGVGEKVKVDTRTGQYVERVKE